MCNEIFGPQTLESFYLGNRLNFSFRKALSELEATAIAGLRHHHLLKYQASLVPPLATTVAVAVATDSNMAQLNTKLLAFSCTQISQRTKMRGSIRGEMLCLVWLF